jgi:hypothetical protein
VGATSAALKAAAASCTPIITVGATSNNGDTGSALWRPDYGLGSSLWRPDYRPAYV